MEERIFNLPDAPLPLDPNSYYEVLVPDGASATGYTSCKIKPANIDGVKRYKATITQTGTAAPVLTVLENSLGALVWTYGGVGTYVGTLVGAFPNAAKVYKYIEDISDYSGAVSALYVNSADDVNINTYSDNAAATPANDLLTNRSILIEVYP